MIPDIKFQNPNFEVLILMAATANNHPPSSSSSSAAVTMSPRSVSTTQTVVSPPWTQIVRGPESESAPPSPSASAEGERSSTPVAEIPVENAENGGNAGGKKAVWNKKPPNGPVENGGPGPVVMGPAEAWPALSESTKASSKPSSSDSSRNLPDLGSASSPQVTGMESSSLSIAPVQSLPQSSSVSPKATTSNLNHNPMPNFGRPARQRSMKRDGGNPHTNGGFSHQPLSAVEGSHNHSSTRPSSGGGFDGSRDNIQYHVHREPVSRNASGDHPQQRSYRRGSGGSHARGDGSHQNYGGRRGDHDRGNHDWNLVRSFNGRDSTVQQRVAPRGYVRPPTVSASYVYPTPMPPFMNPMGVAEMPMVYLPGGVPYGPVAPVFIHPGIDPQLNAKIVHQIDYYFSNENLIKDEYLRKNMDEHGWVPVTLIANFNKVTQLTENIQQILDAVRSSTVVEVQGDKIRKRDDWLRWIMSPSVQFSTASGPQSPMSPTISTLSAHIQNIKVDEKTTDQNQPKGQLDVNDGASSSGH